MLTTMNWNNRTPAVRMLQEMMAAFGTDNFKPYLVQGSYKPTTSYGWEGAHTLTATRWTPTNSFETGCSTSRQSVIASFILFIKTSKELAWVWHPRRAGTDATK